MSNQGAYMLRRDAEESKRLDEQHEFFKELFGGHLLHPSIPLENVTSVADVGTGTGAWLEQTAEWLPSVSPEAKEGKFVGFDVSSAQFPQNPSAPLKFVEHDATNVFPEEYHEAFDVVHIRLLSYGIQAEHVESLVCNVVQLLKPGGYLEWQEGDVIDAWMTPESASMRKRCQYVVSERIARGLTPAFVTPLLTSLINLRQHPPKTDGQDVGTKDDQSNFNLLTWRNDDALRILQLQTCSTKGHPSSLINEKKTSVFGKAGVMFMKLGAERRRALASNVQTSDADARSLREQADEMEALATHPDFEGCTGEAKLTWILARKAVYASMNDTWSGLRYPDIN